MTDKVIEEVDQKLESPSLAQLNSQDIQQIYKQLTQTHREVEKYLHLGKGISNDHYFQQNSRRPGKAHNQNFSRYNYYGKKYRFEQKQQQLKIDPPIVQRSCISQANFQQKHQNPSPYTVKSQKNRNDTQNAIVDQSLFFDDGQIKVPSHQYYIYFDKPEQRHYKSKGKSKVKNVNKQEQQDQQRNQQLPQKFKPAWVLQKKISSLQKQLKQMKERQKRRFGGQTSMQSQQFPIMRNTFDQPINLKSNVERMVETLWR